jgi:hypothetical protein
MTSDEASKFALVVFGVFMHSAIMNRLASLAVLLIAGNLCAADPPATNKDIISYRIILRNASGQISLPDEIRKKTYFIDLDKVGAVPEQYFGGDASHRFKALKFDRVIQSLLCQEVETGKTFTLLIGKEFNLSEATAKSR